MKLENRNIIIDGLDKIILRELMSNSRKSINEISKKAGISGTAVHQRLKKLQESNLISSFQMVLNPKLLGYKTLAFIGIYLEQAIKNPEVVKKLKEIDEVIECYYTTGNWSIFIKIICKDNQHLMRLLNEKIQTINGVSRTETLISLDQQISRQIKI
ncbi:MAG: transcriptional regulator [Flavobacteriaceae bacterium]|nr:transcriptional regulator [Flavobacteriaceae bacterium]